MQSSGTIMPLTQVAQVAQVAQATQALPPATLQPVSGHSSSAGATASGVTVVDRGARKTSRPTYSKIEKKVLDDFTISKDFQVKELVKRLPIVYQDILTAFVQFLDKNKEELWKMGHIDSAQLLFEKNPILYKELLELPKQQHTGTHLGTALEYYTASVLCDSESGDIPEDTLDWMNLPHRTDFPAGDLEDTIEASEESDYAPDLPPVASVKRKKKAQPKKLENVALGVPSALFDANHVPTVQDINHLIPQLGMDDDFLNATDLNLHVINRGIFVEKNDWEQAFDFSESLMKNYGERLFDPESCDDVNTILMEEYPEMVRWLVELQTRQAASPSNPALQLACLWQDWCVAHLYKQLRKQSEHKDIQLDTFNWRTRSKELLRLMKKRKRSLEEQSPVFEASKAKYIKLENENKKFMLDVATSKRELMESKRLLRLTNKRDKQLSDFLFRAENRLDQAAHEQDFGEVVRLMKQAEQRVKQARDFLGADLYEFESSDSESESSDSESFSEEL